MSGIGNYGRRGDLSWTAAIVVTLAVAAFVSWLVLRTGEESGESLATSPGAADVTDAAPIVPVTIAQPSTTSSTTTSAPPTTEQLVATTSTEAADDPVSDTTPSVTDAPDTTAPDTAPPPSEPPAEPTTTPAPSTTVAAPAGPSYPTLPDGSPVPVLGVYDGDSVVVSGNVPTQAAKDLLLGLAIANSQSANPVLTDFVTINPDVPIGIGVRVIDADSERFPDGTAEIRPAHAAQLDRALSIMQLFPDVEVLVIGHSDQRGTERQNFEISRDRAQAVNDYFVANGISPLRISSRAVGEADLLTQGNDAASLALNRRTEFVFYGLLDQ